MANALLGAKVETLKDALPILEHAKSLIKEVPSEKVWLPYLGDALDALESATDFTEALGTPFCQQFIALHRVQWEAYSQQVSDWELVRYANAF